MKRTLVIGLTFALIGGLLLMPAEAKKKKVVTREAQGTYQAPAAGAGNCTQRDGVGCMTIPTGSNERYLTAEVTDSTGQPVVVEVTADLDGDVNTETVYGRFCGKTTEPIKIDPGVALVFWVGRADRAVAATCVPGVGSRGTLDVTFSNVAVK